MSNQERLNAPFGARCFLTEDLEFGDELPEPSLNAPFGARCFLTKLVIASSDLVSGMS